LRAPLEDCSRYARAGAIAADDDDCFEPFVDCGECLSLLISRTRRLKNLRDIQATQLVLDPLQYFSRRTSARGWIQQSA
jgi:hypothetical protein